MDGWEGGFIHLIIDSLLIHGLLKDGWVDGWMDGWVDGWFSLIH